MPHALLIVCLAMLQVQKKEEKFKLSEEEQAVVDATNAERKDNKLGALKANAKLTEAARAHAANMAKQGKLSHELDGENVDKRVERAGYKYRRLGENVAWNWKDAKEAVQSWMDSPPHRANILNKDYTEIGIAAVKNEKGEIYWCQVFGTPR